MKKQRVVYEDLARISYQKAWDYQTMLHELLKKEKLEGKGEEDYSPDHHYFLMCEHEPVFTIGKSGKMDHLLLRKPELESKGISFYKANRGGDITYHGPGQITAYPILDLDFFKRDVHLYVRNLEQVVINVLLDYGIEGVRIDGKTGVWIAGAINQKICAIGVHMSRWVTLHGFALNVSTSLDHFDYIIPCGIRDENMAVCSMESILSKKVDIEEVKLKLRVSFQNVFDFDYV